MNYLKLQILRYKFLSVFLVGLLFAVFLAENDAFHKWLLGLGQFEYLGAFLAGVLFVSSFTVATSIVIMTILADNLHPLMIGLFGGVGAMVGDYLVFKFLKDHLFEELKLLLGKPATAYIKTIVKSPYIAWSLPIIGVFILASPLPDELGVSLLGLSRISQTKFLVLAFLSNAFGILAIASVAKVF